MINSRKFYFTETQSSINYSRTPTGALEIRELIAGNACWIPATLPRVEKQKTLVLADWTAKNWAPEKIEQVIQSLSKLMDQGFSICIWHHGHVSPMNKKDLTKLNRFDVRKNMTLVSSNTVSDVAVKENKLTVDQVQVIDDYWLNYILSDKEEPEPRVLRTSEISALKALIQEEMKDLAKILRSVKPELTKIIHDVFPVRYALNDQAKSLKKWLKSKKVDVVIENDPTNYTKLDFSNMTWEEIESDTPSLLFGKRSEATFQMCLEYFRFSKSLNLSDSNISCDGLKNILDALVDLRTLYLKNCNFLDGELNLSGGSLQHLESLDLTCSTVSVDNLNKILAVAPELRTLNLSGCKRLNGDLREADFRHIESLDVSGSNISANNLSKILSVSSELRMLNLTHLWPLAKQTCSK